MSTSPGSTLSAIDETSVEPEAVDDDEGDVPVEVDLDPDLDDVDLETEDAATEEESLQATWPRPRPAARATMAAAPPSALLRNRWCDLPGGLPRPTGRDPFGGPPCPASSPVVAGRGSPADVSRE